MIILSTIGRHMDVNRIVLARWQLKTIERWRDSNEQEGGVDGSDRT